jgi:hypothetical protein
MRVYDCRRPSGAPRWRCQRYRKDFSLTSGTLFVFHKLALRMYLAAAVIFINEVKGKSTLALSRDLGVQYKTAFVLAHKIREAMAAELRGVVVGGAGKAAEIDGAYFGGHVRPENRKEDRKDRRLAANQTGKRRCVVTIRERDGRTVTGVFPSEDAAGTFIRSRIARGTEVHADEANAWNDLHARYPMRRINHQDAYSQDGACTNGAESFFSRIRRGEIGSRRNFVPPAASTNEVCAIGTSPHPRHLPAPLCPGGGVPRGSPPNQQRRAIPHSSQAGDDEPPLGGLLRILAAQPPGGVISRAPAMSPHGRR